MFFCNIDKNRHPYTFRLYCGQQSMSQTYNPKKRKRAKACGFLSRSKTPAGRRLLQRRRTKGRARIALVVTKK